MRFASLDQYALILGASSGIGLATARKLASEGLHLCLVHRDRRSQMAEIEANFEALRATGRHVLSFNLNALQADNQRSIIQGLKEAFEGEGRIRVLVHALSRGNLKRLTQENRPQPTAETWLSAGLAIDTPWLDSLQALFHPAESDPEAAVLDSSDLAYTLEAMATSLWTWTQQLLAAHLFASDARIIGLTSEGNQKAWPHYAAVSTAKAALEALIRAMARELAPHGIRSNVVQAGITDTPSLRMIPGSEQLKASALLRNPFGRLTRPEDVANVISLLCSDEAAWINGALIPVDGGERLG